MDKQLSVARICRVAAIILAIATSVAGYSRPPSPPRIADFFHDIIGEWVGTVEQSTNGTKTDIKYFHAVAKQTSSDTYEAVFEYYKLDKVTNAPVQAGVTTMTNKITLERTAITTIIGKGDVFVDPKTSKFEEHQLSEVLSMSPLGGLEGKGSGKISVSDTARGAGKNGRVSAYTSNWDLNSGVLGITERLRVTFRALVFSKRYDIVNTFNARRGSNVLDLMKSAGGSANPRLTRGFENPNLTAEGAEKYRETAGNVFVALRPEFFLLRFPRWTFAHFLPFPEINRS